MRRRMRATRASGRSWWAAKAIIGEYQIFLVDPRIAELDDNPFVKLAIRTTVGGTLSTLEKAIV